MRGPADAASADDEGALFRRLAIELDLPAQLLDDGLDRRRLHAPLADDPREVVRRAVVALAEAACEAGDHAAEARIRHWRLDSGLDPDVWTRATAWQALLLALTHIADGASAVARPDLLGDVRARALEATADIGAAARDEGAGDLGSRPLLDPVARLLLRVESELGRAPSAAAAALAERHRLRATRTADGQSFAARHAEDLDRFRADIAEPWFLERFLDRHGVAPPAGWWRMATDELPAGPSPEAAGSFDAEDHVAFLEETEARFRADRGLPLQGEGLVSAASLGCCVEAVLPGVELEREARRPWLGSQRLDIFLPRFDVAIEYQGEQHYLPLAHWGGDAGLVARRELDERKRDACARAGVRLIEWRYDEPISVDRVRRRLADAGIEEAGRGAP